MDTLIHLSDCGSPPWDLAREKIQELWPKKTLIEVRKVMAESYGFEATTKQWKTQLAKWGMDNKKIKHAEYRAMLRIKRAREARRPGTATQFVLRGVEVDASKLSRFERKIANNTIEEDGLEDAPIPPELTYHTPPSSPTPSSPASSTPTLVTRTFPIPHPDDGIERMGMGRYHFRLSTSSSSPTSTLIPRTFPPTHPDAVTDLVGRGYDLRLSVRTPSSPTILSASTHASISTWVTSLPASPSPPPSTPPLQLIQLWLAKPLDEKKGIWRLGWYSLADTGRRKSEGLLGGHGGPADLNSIASHVRKRVASLDLESGEARFIAANGGRLRLMPFGLREDDDEDEGSRDAGAGTGEMVGKSEGRGKTCSEKIERLFRYFVKHSGIEVESIFSQQLTVVVAGRDMGLNMGQKNGAFLRIRMETEDKMIDAADVDSGSVHAGDMESADADSGDADSEDVEMALGRRSIFAGL